jgi:hypothetical protein
LAQIKKKHDEAKKLGNKRQDDLEKVRKEIEQLNLIEVQGEGPIHEMKSKLEMLNDSLEETKYKTDEENFTK